MLETILFSVIVLLLAVVVGAVVSIAREKRRRRAAWVRGVPVVTPPAEVPDRVSPMTNYGAF